MAAATGRVLSRRDVLKVGPTAGSALVMAACGDPIVVDRVVVVPQVVEREVVVEQPVFTERVVIVEKPVVVEQRVVVTRLVTPLPSYEPSPTTAGPPGITMSTATSGTERPAQTAPIKVRAAISAALVGDGTPDFSAVDSFADLDLEVLDDSGNVAERLLARAAAGDLPDVLIGIPGSLVTGLDELEMLAPLDSALGPEQEFLPEMTALGRRRRGLAGMPITGHPTYLLASRERLDHAGIADIGSRYADLGEAARRLTDPETHRYGFGVVSGLPELETVTRSAGQVPWSDSAVAAWQWYADLWLQERVSPPPVAWDGQGGAGEAVASSRVALAVAHGRALRRLVDLPADLRATCEVLPLPAWMEQARQVPMAAAFTAARSDSDVTALEAVVTLAGPAKIPDSASGIPAWTPALGDTAIRLGLDLEQLLDSRDAWARPLAEDSVWRQQVASLDAAVVSTLVLGQPVHDAAAALEAEFAQATAARG